MGLCSCQVTLVTYYDSSHATLHIALYTLHMPLDLKFSTFVKLRQGSGKERQGKARKGKDGER